MNKASLKVSVYFIVIVVFLSCEKEPTTVELLKGDYSLKYASVDGENITGYLISDSINMYRLFTAEIENTHPFIFYFRPYMESYYTYEFSFRLNGDKQIVIKRLGTTGSSNTTLEDNLAFLPFTKQDELTLNIETLTENQLSFNTFFREKKYRYEFKD